MTCVSLTRAATIAPIVAFLDRLGVAKDRLLATAGLPPWIMDERETLIPGTTPARILAAARRHADVRNLGLIVAERIDVGMLGTFGRLVRSAPTLGDALGSAIRYSAAMTSNRPLSVRSRGAQVEFCMTIGERFDPRDVAAQQDNQFSLGLMIAAVRLAVGPHWRPAAVHLQTAEDPGLRDADSLAGARIEFRQPATMVAIPRALLATRLPPVPPTEMPTDLVDWTSSAPAGDFAGSIRQAVDTLSFGGQYPNVRQTAEFVRLSVRTLQRGLAAAGANHEVLVAQARFAAAAAVLEQTNAKIVDLALDLGYSDHANFTRAFRRWVGCSPREYRRRHREHHGESCCRLADMSRTASVRGHEALARAVARPSHPMSALAIGFRGAI